MHRILLKRVFDFAVGLLISVVVLTVFFTARFNPLNIRPATFLYLSYPPILSLYNRIL
jgi:hypothetical protein